MSVNWTQQEAIELCRQIEKICPKFGCHVALTGGLLYRDGERKDCDILFYRIRQVPKIEIDALWVALEAIGLEYESGMGWCQKATFKGKNVDCFFPEGEGDETEYTAEQLAERQEIKQEVAAMRYDQKNICVGTEQLTGTDQNMLGKPSQNNLADVIQ